MCVFPTAFSRLDILEHLFKIPLDSALALARLIVPAVGNQFLILTYSVGYPILANCARSLAKFISGLLPVLTHSSCRLIDIFLKPGDLLSERLFPIADLLLSIISITGLRIARQLLDTL